MNQFPKLFKEDKEILKTLGMKNSKDSISIEFFHFINNPDGTIRWIYPKNNNNPSFLKFYNVSSWKSYLIDRTIRTFYFLNLKKVVASGNIDVQIEENSILKNVLEDSKDYSFSIFTGTKGDNRKVVIEADSINYGKIFSKLAISVNSKRLIQTEYENLNFLNSLKLTSVIIPKVLKYNSDKGLLTIEDVRPKKFKKSNKISELKVYFLQNLLIRTETEKVLSETQFYSILKGRVGSLNLLNEKTIGGKNISGLIRLLLVFLENLEEDKSYKFSFAHGDFTPWNLFETQKDLRVIDWELGKLDIPVFYDYFHYFFQSEILINRNASDEIFKKIKEVELLNEMKSLIKDDYLILYLLEVSSYYIEKFLKQEDLHEQVFWLLDTWEESFNILQKNKLFINE